MNEEVKICIDKSVLCWLATVDNEGKPNVSPKEMFMVHDNKILIANIAFPNSVKNIEVNSNVCLSVIDIFLQKGFKINGQARLIHKNTQEYILKVKYLIEKFSDLFPLQSIIEIEVNSIHQIIAPSYFLFPDRTEKFQIASAMSTYKVKPIDDAW